MDKNTFNKLCDQYGIEYIYDTYIRPRTSWIVRTTQGDWRRYTANSVIDENKVYMTIRAGLGGIYYMFDTYKNGGWEGKVLDESITLYYKEFDDIKI